MMVFLVFNVLILLLGQENNVGLIQSFVYHMLLENVFLANHSLLSINLVVYPTFVQYMTTLEDFVHLV